MDDYFINTKEQYHISYLLLLEIYVNGVWPSLLSHCFEFEKKETGKCGLYYSLWSPQGQKVPLCK